MVSSHSASFGSSMTTISNIKAGELADATDDFTRHMMRNDIGPIRDDANTAGRADHVRLYNS